MLSHFKNIDILLICIYLLGCFLSTMMAIGQIIIRNKTSRQIILFLLFSSFAIIQLYSLLFVSRIYGHDIYLYPIYIPPLYLVGPLLYLFSRITLEEGFAPHRKHLMHGIPSLISLIAMIIVSIHGSISDKQLQEAYSLNAITYSLTDKMIFSGGVVTTLIYFLFIKIKTNIIWDPEIIKNEPIIKIILSIIAVSTLSCLFNIAALFTNDMLYMHSSLIILTCIIMLLFLANYRYPNLYNDFCVIIERERQKRSYLAGLDINNLKKNIMSMMIDEEIFQDEDLSLKSFSEKLSISPHQLSQLLNEFYGKNFNAFINEYRIEKAKTLLSKDKSSTILSIAYDVGFKSKSSFNSVFSNLAGLSPSEYRKKK